MTVTLCRGLTVPNRDGHLPFPLEFGPNREPIVDIYQPNDAYFSFVDRLIPVAAKVGITLTFVPTWGRYITGGLQGGPAVFDRENSRSYGEFLGERYPFHPWVLGGDTNRYWNPETVAYLNENKDVNELEVIDYKPTFDAMREGIAEGEKRAIAKLSTQLRDKAKGYETFFTFHSTQGDGVFASTYMTYRLLIVICDSQAGSPKRPLRLWPAPSSLKSTGSPWTAFKPVTPTFLTPFRIGTRRAVIYRSERCTRTRRTSRGGN